MREKPRLLGLLRLSVRPSSSRPPPVKPARLRVRSFCRRPQKTNPGAEAEEEEGGGDGRLSTGSRPAATGGEMADGGGPSGGGGPGGGEATAELAAEEAMLGR